MTPWAMGGSPHTILATARARSGRDTVTLAGKEKWRWFWGRVVTRLTTTRVTAACLEHRAALPHDTGPPGLTPDGRGLAGWVALVGVATWLPQPAATGPAPAAAATSSPARVRRLERVTGTPIVVSVPVHLARDQAGK